MACPREGIYGNVPHEIVAIINSDDNNLIYTLDQDTLNRLERIENMLINMTHRNEYEERTETKPS